MPRIRTRSTPREGRSANKLTWAPACRGLILDFVNRDIPARHASGRGDGVRKLGLLFRGEGCRGERKRQHNPHKVRGGCCDGDHAVSLDWACKRERVRARITCALVCNTSTFTCMLVHVRHALRLNNTCRCMYLYMQRCMYMFMSLCVRACTRVRVCMCVRACVRVCERERGGGLCGCVFVYVCMCVCVWVCSR